MTDKAIRAAKLTLGGMLEKKRAKEAASRAGGQIAPSKYLPDVPRQAHALGGVPMNMLPVGRIAVAEPPRAAPASMNPMAALSGLSKLGDTLLGMRKEPESAEPQREADQDVTAPATAPRPHDYDTSGMSDAATAAFAKLQETYGQPLSVVSAYRDPKRNEDVGGAKGSQHIHGNAYDIDTSHLTHEERLALADQAWASGFRGIGFYDNNMHFDVGDPRAWGPDYHSTSIPGWAQPWAQERYGYADGGAATAGMFQGIHPDLQDDEGKPLDLWHGTPAPQGFDRFSNEKIGGRDAGFYGTGHYLTPDHEIAQDYASDEEGVPGKVMGPMHAALKNPFVWDVSSDQKTASTQAKLEGFGIKRQGRMDPWDNLRGHEVNGFTKKAMAAGHDGVVYKTSGGVKEIVVFDPKMIKHRDAEVFDPTDPRIYRAYGGRTLNSLGLYSKAAEVIRGMAQERGTVDQYIAAAKKSGVKPSEIANAGDLPTGKIGRDELADIFKSRVPGISEYQYGENPSFTKRGEANRFYDLQDRFHKGTLSPDEDQELKIMMARHRTGPNVIEHEEGNIADTNYSEYTLPGGQNYRERLLKLKTKDRMHKSSHWDVPNVIAHIRMQDQVVGPTRSFADAKKWVQPVVEKIAEHMGASPSELGAGSADYAVKNGLITPEEAATLTKIKGWRNNGYDDKPGIDKRLLHVEELQSDWAQEGRDKGFYDPKKPYQLYDWNKGIGISNHGVEEEAVKAADAMGPDATVSVRRMNTGRPDNPPAAPYVTNTQHWTDLALKNVLREAAKGNYDGIVFSPGQAQADRYDLERQVDAIHYHPDTKTLLAQPKNGGPAVTQTGVEPKDVAAHIGKEAADKLLDPANAYTVNGTTRHSLVGDDLKMGGQGMKGYYDKIIPKSAMQLVQQHDPSITPQSVKLPSVDGGSYDALHIPMTDQAKKSILTEGFQAFATGGSVKPNNVGLYSKAAEIVSGLPMNKAPADQFAKAIISKGGKKSEVNHIGFEGFAGSINKGDILRHIQDNQPEIDVKKLEGGYTKYDRYQLPNGENYREHILTLPKNKETYMAKQHWGKIENPLGHIRMSDRMVPPSHEDMLEIFDRAKKGNVGIDGAVERGNITPQEAATLARYFGANYSDYYHKPGLEKRLLHVEEAQSDWSNHARVSGFRTGREKQDYDDYVANMRQKMIERTKARVGQNYYDPVTGDVAPTMSPMVAQAQIKKYETMDPYMLAMKLGVQSEHNDMARKANENLMAPPKAPYISQDGSDWDQLAMKHVLTEAAKGGYDGITFTPDEEQSHRWGGTDFNGIYNKKLPGIAAKLMKAHDDKATVSQTALPSGIHDGVSGAPMISLSPEARQSVIDKGFPSFRRGGAVKKAEGGPVTNEQGIASGGDEAFPQEGGLPDAGGIRRGTGVLSSQDEAPLQGLPQSVGIPATGGMIKAGPDPHIRNVARQYMASSGLKYSPPNTYAKVDPARAKRIAAAYDAMPHNPDDPLTKASYDAMIKEAIGQYKAAKAAGFKAEFWNPEKDEDPYHASPRLAVEDVRKNNHMWVFPTYAGYGSGQSISDEDVRKNPMLRLTGETWNGIPVTANDIFRAIHDYFGHAKEGVGFRHDGEENAWRAHASMFSPLARLAMTTETRGQNSWLNFGPHGDKNRSARTEDTVFAPQKMGILPHWAHHEGAEDFMTPEDIAEMQRQRSKHGNDVSKALDIVKRFTKR